MVPDVLGIDAKLKISIELDSSGHWPNAECS